jgi:hypothetical protein
VMEDMQADEAGVEVAVGSKIIIGFRFRHSIMRLQDKRGMGECQGGRRS